MKNITELLRSCKRLEALCECAATMLENGPGKVSKDDLVATLRDEAGYARVLLRQEELNETE